MAKFVLVHGAFSGAWIWGPLEERLDSAGHTTAAFDLPLLGAKCVGITSTDYCVKSLETCMSTAVFRLSVQKFHPV